MNQENTGLWSGNKASKKAHAGRGREIKREIPDECAAFKPSFLLVIFLEVCRAPV
jgi:hypothetical protein